MKFQLNQVYVETLPATFGRIPMKRLAQTLRDGRASAFLIYEHLLAQYENLRRMTDDPRLPDCIRHQGRRTLQVRTVTQNGVALNPHKQNGIGRRYDRLEHMIARRQVEGYILVDVTEAPKVTYAFVPLMRVPENAKFSCKDAQSLISLASAN